MTPAFTCVLVFMAVPLNHYFGGFRSVFFVKLPNAYLDSSLHIGLRFHGILLSFVICWASHCSTAAKNSRLMQLSFQPSHSSSFSWHPPFAFE
jgi:hypothetical protein